MRKKIILALFMVFIIMGGCSKHESKDAQMSLVKTIHPTPLKISNTADREEDMLNAIEHDVESMQELYDAAVLKGEKEILVAYKVKHLQRFHMKKIEKKLNKILEEKYPDENFIVSSDFKIFLEAVELHDLLLKYEVSEEEAQEKFDKIIKLKKEMT